MRRARSKSKSLTLAGTLAVIMIVLLAGCGGAGAASDHVAQSFVQPAGSGSPGAPLASRTAARGASLPKASPTSNALAALPSINPIALFGSLATTPFSPGEMPPGFAGGQVKRVAPDQLQNTGEFGLTTAFALSAQAGVVAVISNEFTYIFYAVFSGPSGANAAYTSIVSGFQRAGLQDMGPIDYIETADSMCVSGYWPMGVPPDYYATLCVSQIGNVLIMGSSAIPSNQEQTVSNARDLTRAGIAHLERVVANGVPTASPTVTAGEGDGVTTTGDEDNPIG